MQRVIIRSSAGAYVFQLLLSLPVLAGIGKDVRQFYAGLLPVARVPAFCQGSLCPCVKQGGVEVVLRVLVEESVVTAVPVFFFNAVEGGTDSVYPLLLFAAVSILVLYHAVQVVQEHVQLLGACRSGNAQKESGQDKESFHALSPRSDYTSVRVMSLM